MLWSAAVEGGPARVYHASVAVDRCVYTFGGRYCGYEVPEDAMEVHVLHTTSLESAAVRVQGDRSPPNLLGHSAVAFGQHVYVWGGYHSFPFHHVGQSELWCFDTATHRWSQAETSGDVPSPRIHHTACVVDGRMFVIGGFERRFGFPMQVVHALNLHTMVWTVFRTSDSSPQAGVYRSAILTKAQEGSTPREGAAQICLYGGSTSRALFPTGHDQHGLELFVKQALGQMFGWKVAYLDAVSGEWYSTSSPYLPSLTGSCGFVYGQHLYMTITGPPNSSQSGKLFRRGVDDNDLEEMQPLGAVPMTRCMGSCVVVDDRVFLIGGATLYPTVKTDVDRLDDSTEDNSKIFNNANEKYDTLMHHYGALQVLDFRPDLRTMCIAVIAQYNLKTESLPLTLQREVELCTPKFRAIEDMFPS